jgi:hypothetical protein
MIRTGLLLGISAVVASAWFMPTMSFGIGDDSTNIDKNFVRDEQKKVVVNKKTSKMYSDIKPSSKIHFYGAWEYCQKMDLAGFHDWRVISKKEAKNLLELSRRKITIKHAFQNVKDDIYWTSTQDRYSEAWYVDFDLGRYSTKKRVINIMCFV